MALQPALSQGQGNRLDDTFLLASRSIQDPLEGLPERLKRVVGNALEGETLSPQEAHLLAAAAPEHLAALCRAASLIRERGKGHVVTFSPKVFIPLTRLCRDLCGYCTFRQNPQEATQLYMDTDQVLEVARAGQQLGCSEALFTLGERPEQRYAEAKTWLARRGYRTTLDYLHQACRLVLEETALLPHGNPGTMSRREMIHLREVNASMGTMLESVSPRLAGPGGPHELAPSKGPRARISTLRMAGELNIPFTTGILMGIGETLAERVDSLLAIRELQRRYGHIQEVIVQNFQAKPNTAMAGHPEPGLEDLLWSVAAARLILGPDCNIQVPPNLSAGVYPLFLLAGINDWGGISPVTIDYVNPEAPWPQVSELRRTTEALGFVLKPRLPIYPEYILEGDEYLSPLLKERIKPLADDHGYLKGGIERYASLQP
ncbi:MAG: Radical domain protein [Dehalococcoidia bacterium]|nr:Radical domain protein [Dehalococcoidia bacterium]